MTMTDNQERNVRAASKILRDLNRDNPEFCAVVLDLEAQILDGDNLENPIPRFVGMLQGTANVILDIAKVINGIDI